MIYCNKDDLPAIPDNAFRERQLKDFRKRPKIAQASHCNNLNMSARPDCFLTGMVIVGHDLPGKNPIGNDIDDANECQVNLKALLLNFHMYVLPSFGRRGSARRKTTATPSITIPTQSVAT